ncbi:MAG: TetR/AcrR family transcriptional regulator [Oceanospirillales bacterium]|nr:TetR/AcrR family transcriptional regulator [Oceanospirillales bacterium]
MDMKDTILEVATRLAQQRGVNGFSYADIAKEVGVSKPSLHHHFATKSDLVARLLEQYTEQVIDYLSGLDSDTLPARKRVDSYIDLYRHTLNCDRMCLGGMLAAEALTLEPGMKKPLSRFFEYQQSWLEQTLLKGQTSGEFHLAMPAAQQAKLMIAALQGALVVSRGKGDATFFEHSAEGLISTLG